MSCGQCCEMGLHTRLRLRLDIFIEIPSKPNRAPSRFSGSARRDEWRRCPPGPGVQVGSECPPWYEASFSCIRCDGPCARRCARGEQPRCARYLCFQELLEHPLHDLVQEVWVIQQDPLRHLCIQPTMIWGHRRSFSIGCLRTPTILEDDDPSF